MRFDSLNLACRVGRDAGDRASPWRTHPSELRHMSFFPGGAHGAGRIRLLGVFPGRSKREAHGGDLASHRSWPLCVLVRRLGVKAPVSHGSTAEGVPLTTA